MSNFNIKEIQKEKFYQLPKVFFTNPKYVNLSNDAKITWSILRDRLDKLTYLGFVKNTLGN